MPATFEDWMKIIVVVVQQDRAVAWTKPEEFTYDPKDLFAGIEGQSLASCMMLTASSELPPVFQFALTKEWERDRVTTALYG